MLVTVLGRLWVLATLGTTLRPFGMDVLLPEEVDSFLAGQLDMVETGGWF